MDARRAFVLNRLLCRYRNRVSFGFGFGVSGIIRVTNQVSEIIQDPLTRAKTTAIL